MPAQRSSRSMAAAIVYTGAVMTGLSNNVVAVAFPVLDAVFHTSPAVVAWVAIAYTLTAASLLTTFGRLSDMRGRKGYYALGIGVFIGGSALCSLSPNIGALIGFRVLQGVGSALINANSIAYLVEIYPANRRGFIVGVWEACIGAGLALGPIVGGGLLAAFGWQAVFFVNVPFGLAILALMPKYMVEPARERYKQSFDVPGALLFATAVATLLYALTEAYDLGWGSPVILACLALGIITAVLFIWTEIHDRQPMVDLAMFHNWTFSAGNLAKVFAYLPLAANTFLLPFYLEQAINLTPATVGLSLTPLPVGMVCSSLVFGPLSDRIGARKLAPAGLALEGLAAALFTQVSPSRGFALLLVAMLIAGVGVGAFIAPNDSSILSATPMDKLGVANGIMGISRQLGLVLGYSLAAGLLAARLAANGQSFVPSFQQVNIAVAIAAFAGIWFATARAKPRIPHQEYAGV